MKKNEDFTPAIVVMGGGTGASNLLQELKTLTPDITAIVTTFDSGGSSGVLREKHGLPAPGDIRRCLAALGSNPEQSALFNRRLSNGHAVGNLVLCDLARRTGSFTQAVKAAAKILDITGRVLPVSSDASAQLVMSHGNEEIRGEYNIGTFPVTDPSARVYLSPDAELHPDAAEAIHRADMIIITPGSLLTSLAAVLSPRGVKEALRSSKAKLVNVANLRPEKPHTPDNWHVADHVQALEDYAGRPFDTVIYHVEQTPQNHTILDFEPSKFGKIQAAAIGVPIAKITDGTITHDARLVTEQIRQLLAY